ncbi:hypothetical protein, partial [Mesorhizobium sp. LNJC384A00]|uniref:hypothetical protein n=1 Tax=Mesorhizobium sp. LNJC384A00 TaxID=1287268 RepID=UPI001FD9B4F5
VVKRPATPYQRLLDDARTPEDTRLRLKAMYLTLDPVRLLRTARHCRSKTFCPGCGLRGVVGK